MGLSVLECKGVEGFGGLASGGSKCFDGLLVGFQASGTGCNAWGSGLHSGCGKGLRAEGVCFGRVGLRFRA